MKAYACSNPGTVMIHPQNALLACRAVMSPDWFDIITFETILGLFAQFNLFLSK